MDKSVISQWTPEQIVHFGSKEYINKIDALLEKYDQLYKELSQLDQEISEIKNKHYLASRIEQKELIERLWREGVTPNQIMWQHDIHAEDFWFWMKMLGFDKELARKIQKLHDKGHFVAEIETIVGCNHRQVMEYLKYQPANEDLETAMNTPPFTEKGLTQPIRVPVNEICRPERPHVRSSNLLDRTIDSLDFSSRIKDSLQNHKIGYIGELVQLKSTDLLRWNNLGQKSVLEIKNFLREIGFELGMELDGWISPRNRGAK